MQAVSIPAGRSPSPSIGSPSTLNIRPRVHSPTGTQIPLPVADTSIPRAIPSLPAIIMQRTSVGADVRLHLHHVFPTICLQQQSFMRSSGASRAQT